MSTPRSLLKRNLVPRSFLLGMAVACILFVAGSPWKTPIMVATIMPGIYFGFAYIRGSWLELLEESLTCAILIAVYTYCLEHVEEFVYWAPLSLGIHGLVDLLHHFQLYPSEKHVHACASEYPLMCASVDLGLCVTLSGLLYAFGY